ncbi:hypothetical protein BJX61DRAFT_415615 [Aspergillus egyptiacus]|nr:hypothetical protein BJX61DRAFT_415615 [Aspergillus egyptiacus]
MENDGSEKQRTTRIRTGDFEEPFAQEANNRRQQGQPLRLIPPLQPIVSKHKARQNSWNWRPQSKITDDEKAEVHQVVYDLPTAPLSIQFASRRAPIGSRSPLLFLTTRAESSSSHAGDTRWLHIQHTGIRFETFVERALAAADLPSETREGIRDWLSGLQTALESNVSNGMTFPATVKGSMFADADGCEKSMADHSCLFLALPYFLLSDGKYPNRDSQSHPVRALVERLYSNESPFSREFRQAVNQLDRTATKKILYVPQIWCLLIGNDYIVTCAPSQLHTRPTSYIATVPGDEHPATVRLKLRWGLVFCIRAEECKSWFVCWSFRIAEERRRALDGADVDRTSFFESTIYTRKSCAPMLTPNDARICGEARRLTHPTGAQYCGIMTGLVPCLISKSCFRMMTASGRAVHGAKFRNFILIYHPQPWIRSTLGMSIRKP